jgi:uncharacterized repeat protein (TIGR01451 family)
MMALFSNFVKFLGGEDRQVGSIFRILLVVTVITFGWSTSACGQSANRRMIPAQSLKELVSEDPTQEGIVQIRIGQLFKQGTTEYESIDRKTLKDAPPLPTGYRPFKDQVYRVTTEAMVSGEHVVVFHLPSVSNQAEFKRLEVLYLDVDEMSPLGKSWIPVTVVDGAWDENVNRSIPKTTYDQLLRDFSSRRIAAISEDFGVFAIAIAPETYEEPKEPFTRMELVSTSFPEAARKNEKVTHTFTIKNNGPVKAEEVNFKEELGNDLEFESAEASQGRCRQSNRSTNRVLCHFGSMAASTNVIVKITMRVNKNALFTDSFRPITSRALLAFKQNSTDFIHDKTEILAEVETTILEDP